MKMWVFRLPTGQGGDPKGRACSPNEINGSEIEQGFRSEKCVIDYKYDSLEFVLAELFKFGNLRQGWGIPTLDLRLPEKVWIGKYILATYKYWDENVGCDAARGRRNILVRMLDMNKGDIIFLPRIAEKGENSHHLTVVTVRDEYFFEDRSQDDIKDFAHMIKVDKIKTYQYPIDDVNDGIFGAPFMDAVHPVEENYANNVYHRLEDFLINHYL